MAPPYFLALCGTRRRRHGALPAARTTTPPTPRQVFAEAKQGWWCFGRKRGGRIYDPASLMAGGAWGRELRGEAFRSVRELIAAAIR
jgi:hypothetical protein